MKKTFPLVLVLFCMTLFISCEKSTTEEEITTDAFTKLSTVINSLDNTTWAFTNYSKHPFEAQYENIISLDFSDVTDNGVSYSGKSVVNRYLGSIKINRQEGLIIEKGDAITTLKTSTVERDNEIESDYYTNLYKAAYFEIKNEVLLLYLGSPEDENVEIMHFKQKN